MVNSENVFSFFRDCVATQESKVFFLLAILCVVMIVDFLLGSVAAWRNPNINFNSSEGINGIIRKIGSLVVMLIVIPLSVLVPGGTGIAALSVLYIGYIVMEFASILENLRKLGVDISPLQKFAEKVLGANGGKGNGEH